MTVQELITQLKKIENKNLVVVNGRSMYQFPVEYVQQREIEDREVVIVE